MLQQRRPDAAVVDLDLLVCAQQILWNLPRDIRTVPADPRFFCVEIMLCGGKGVTGSRQLDIDSCAIGEVPSQGRTSILKRLQQFEFLVFQHFLPTTERRNLVLEFFELLRTGDAAAIKECLIFARPHAHLLDIVLEFAHLAFAIRHLGLAGDDQRPKTRKLRFGFLEAHCLGEIGPTVRDLVEMGVGLLQIEESELCERISDGHRPIVA